MQNSENEKAVSIYMTKKMQSQKKKGMADGLVASADDAE